MPPALLLPVDRAAGAGRAVLMLLAGVCLAVPVVLVWPSLRLRPSGGTILWQDYAVAWLLMLSAAGALASAARAGQWLLLAAWRGRLFVRIDERGISGELGPFGRWSTEWGDVVIDWPEYLFRLELDAGAALPMKECPPLRDARTKLRIDAALRRYVTETEDEWWPRVERFIRPRLFSDARWG